MNEQERIDRLENAMAALAELSANHEVRLKELAELAARSEKTQQTLRSIAADHQRLLVDHERRISNFDEAFQILKELAQRHGEGVDELRAAQAESEQKIAALADAQIRTEEALAEAGRKIDVLAESQAHSDRKLDALIDAVRDLLDGRRPGGGPVI